MRKETVFPDDHSGIQHLIKEEGEDTINRLKKVVTGEQIQEYAE
jgi:hypothetical protein